jgi:predicted nucleic acid-binding protein
MKVMLDLNVLLDVIQKRQAHFRASAELLDRVARGAVQGCTAAHAVTTIHYIVAKHAGSVQADAAVDWLLAWTAVLPAGREHFLRARALALPDFEDAVVAALAEAARCDYVATRNVTDYRGSPVPALTPEELLALLAETRRDKAESD